MSEYQYYEFQAVERALDRKEQAALRAVSSRGEITPTSYVNTYEYGDFKGSPLKWMEKYFDAHFYTANWGDRVLMLRLPKAALAVKLARRYWGQQPGQVHEKGRYLILEIYSGQEWASVEHEDLDEGTGWLTRLLPLRDELLAGDHRALYLGWLLGAWARAEDGADELEPPVPPGLDSLTPAQQALAEFLRLGRDWLAGASAGSRPLPKAPGPKRMARWVAGLPEAEKTAALVRVLAGEGAAVRNELLAKQAVEAEPSRASAQARPRSLAELRAASKDAWQRRRR